MTRRNSYELTYLVVRDGMLRHSRVDGIRMGMIRSSDNFPMLVTIDVRDVQSGESISVHVVNVALEAAFGPEYEPDYKYVVVPMENALTVQRRPIKPQYTHEVKEFHA